MPLSAVIYLSPSENVTLRAAMGLHAHDVLHTLLRSANPEKAEELYARSERKRQFTVSPLIAKGTRIRNLLHLQAGTECKFRFTFLNDMLFYHFEPIFTDPLPPVPLGQANFQINDVRTTAPETDGWGSIVPYDQLIDTARTETQMQIHFHSPTAIPRVQGKHHETSINLPWFYQNWIKKWNTFAPMWIYQDKLLEFVENRAGMTAVDIKNGNLYVGTRQIPGLVGTCTYKFFMEEVFPDPDDLKMLRLANLLADYAFYCGTGSKTITGMGQTRRESF